MIVKIAARVRGAFAGNYPENREDEQLHINSRGDQLISEGLPPLTELVRLGNSYGVLGTATALVTALPTTTSGLSLWNGEPAGGKSYIIESVGIMDVVVDATQADQTAIVAMMNRTPVTAPTDSGLLPRSLNGRSGYGGKARTTLLNTVVDDGWLPAGRSAAGSAAAAGSAWKVTEVPLRGLYIIPPGGMFSIAGIKVAAAVSGSRYFMRWHEAQIIINTGS